LLGPKWRIDKRTLQVQGYRERLAEGVELTMVQIPAGSFLMGSPSEEPERYDKEGPQHQVQLQGFFMGQTPITQAQWQVVAGWQKLQRDLNSDPAHFKGLHRPVESVLWEDAIEFCQRLSQRFGRIYTLPSEAQWEYACRAGTTTPFHFGATLTPDLANYDGSSTYREGPKGVDRQETTEVASFPANPWGLYDMHGNVSEWCLDQWHANYQGAPADGSAWPDSDLNNYNQRLLRGGSWDFNPRGCRSAYRIRYRPVVRDSTVGFRVCCLPQGRSSLPLIP
jgi:formylglycine-generating enzyme required for sulfatase activity